MLTSILFNIGSLLFGMMAWTTPFLAMKQPRIHYGTYIIISFSACIIALILQFFEVNQRVQMQDWAGLMDTIGTLKWIALILTIITIILNIFVLLVRTEQQTPNN